MSACLCACVCLCCVAWVGERGAHEREIDRWSRPVPCARPEEITPRNATEPDMRAALAFKSPRRYFRGA
jgi:hypothetical protein